MKRARLVASAAVLLITSMVLAQNAPQGGREGGRPAGGLGGAAGGLGQGGPGGAGGLDPNMLIDNLMKGDKNGDGKLSKDELPARFVERNFDSVDANKDGSLDRDELSTFAKAQMEGRGRPGEGAQEGRGEGRGEGPGAARGQRGGSFEGGMKQAGRGIKGIEKSEFTAESKNADLDAVSLIQAGIASSKGLTGQVKMSEAAKKKFGTDEAAFRAELRKQLFETLKAAIALEEAINAGNSAGAKAAFASLGKLAEAGHGLFQEEEHN